MGSLSVGVNCPTCQTDHSPPTNAEIKSEWRYDSFHPCALMACKGTTLSLVSGVKEQDNGGGEDKTASEREFC